MRFTAVFYEPNGRITSVQYNATANVVGSRDYIQASFNGDPEDFYVANGEILPKGEKPSAAHIFDYSSASWALDIEEAKRQAWNRIKSYRHSEEFGVFTWNSNSFQCDERSQARIMSAVQMAQIDSAVTMTWTLSDNTTKTFNGTELKQIVQAMFAHIDSCHTKARGKRLAINSATTQVEIEAITW
tara:strand:+ start:11 stop:568 length:558 start_codon:yes stop_codon:yes gene_type:complete